MIIHLSDNNYGKEPVFQGRDSGGLDHIASFKLTDKVGSLLLFPQSFRDTEFYSAYQTIEKAPVIIELIRDPSESRAKIRTGNVMGFIGYNDTEIRIHSRFDKKDNDIEKDADDFLLYHMLAKIFHVNLFNLDTTSSRKNNILDLLMVMFPQMLKDAMSQGLYKEYRTYQYNDARARGTIEVNRFIREDIPFQGKVAYRTREFSHDNKILQLVRHTIEYMRHHPWGHGLLNNDMDTRSNVLQIVNATPTYTKRDRLKVLNDNRRPVSHPYYTKYRALQQLCVSILRHDGLQYGDEKDKVHGILFDGAWLWEEYMAVVLREQFDHFTQKNAFDLFQGEAGKYFQKIIPDYLSKGWADGDNASAKAVADAKYMRLEDRLKLQGEQAYSVYYKTIMYMHRFNSKKGFIFYPMEPSPEGHEIKELSIAGTESKIYMCGFRIPQVSEVENSTRNSTSVSSDFAAFRVKMENCSEKSFREEITSRLNQGQ